MCGISGIVSTRATREFAAGRVRAMMAALAHRGPDGSGIWNDPGLPLVLGHNRLAIIDRTDAGAQPMLSRCGRYVVVFNGEIYNFRALRAELDGAERVAWRGHADTEVLVECIHRWGVEQAIARFEGMFAFCVWDRAERKLCLVRDRIGEKPLYYGTVDGHFAFASEIGALRSAFGDVLRINEGVLCEYLRAGHIPTPHTVYRGIFKLPAAHLLWLDAGADAPVVAAPRAYWSLADVLLRDERVRLADHEAESQLEHTLSSSVAERLVSDVPVGAFLSGGIDSALVTAMMVRHSPAPVRTFTVAFDDPAYDESQYARAVASHLGIVDHHEYVITAADLRDIAPRLGTLFGEPFADSSHVPTLLLAREARRHITVALSGDGSDELFGGYDKYFDALRVWRILSLVPASLRRALARLIALPPVGAWDAVLRHFPSHPAPGERTKGDRIRKLASVIPARDRHELFALLSSNWRPASEAVRSHQFSSASSTARHPWLDALSFEDEMMATDLLGFLPDGILTKLDRTTMAMGLEARSPFLAENVVRLASRLPASCKMRHGRGKVVLRRMLSRHLPSDLVNRPKKGFVAPLDVWLRGELRPWAEELLEAGRLEAAGFRSRLVRDKWREHVSGAQNWQFALWPVLMWQAFFAANATSDSCIGTSPHVQVA